MRNVLKLAVLAAFLGVLPCAHAADVTGTWKGSFDFQGTNVPVAIHLTAVGSTVTGTVEGLATAPIEIHDGKLDGDSLTFWLNSDYEGTTYKLVYKGKVGVGQIEFSFGTEEGSWGADMTVKKADEPAAKPIEPEKPIAPELAGTWKGGFDFQGTSVPLTFNLKSSGGVVTGIVEGLPTTPAEIHEGKLDGDTLTFWLTTDYQGTPVKLVYKGKVSAGQIVFSFGTEDGSWGTELTATKSI